MMFKYLTISCVFITLLISECWSAQPYEPVRPDPLLESWRWRSFPELMGKGLRCLTEDSHENMWFGVDDGVMTYDGLRWKTYTLTTDSLTYSGNVLCAGPNGDVYAGTSIGIWRFQNGEWNRLYPAQGTFPWVVQDLLMASDGSLWAGTPWGALHFKPERTVLYTTQAIATGLKDIVLDIEFEVVPEGIATEHVREGGIGIDVPNAHIDRFLGTQEPKPVLALISNGPGEKADLKVGDRIVAVDGQTAFRYDLFLDDDFSATLTIQRGEGGEPFEVVVRPENQRGTYQTFAVKDVFEDRESRIWFGLQYGKVIRTDIYTAKSDRPSNWTSYTFGAFQGPRLLAQTSDGTMWVAAGNNGIFRLDGKEWKRSYETKTVYKRVQSSILATSDGKLWVGGHWGRLLIYDGRWRDYSYFEDGIPIPRTGRVIGLHESKKGTIWIAGFRQEAARWNYSSKKFETYLDLSQPSKERNGILWFRTQDSSVVRFDGLRWLKFNTKDGLMERPITIQGTRDGTVWGIGKHHDKAATAQFDGLKWKLKVHYELSGLSRFTETARGDLWFRATFADGQKGLARFYNQKWSYHLPPYTPNIYGKMIEMPDGSLWGGGYSISAFDGEKWTQVSLDKNIHQWIETLYLAKNGDLWIGTRSEGLLQRSEDTWTQHTTEQGLSDNRIQPFGIRETDDGHIWVSTNYEGNRFDGKTWTKLLLPKTGIWLNAISQTDPIWYVWHDTVRHTSRYTPDTDAPETDITISISKVAQPGNVTLVWKGVDLWHDTMKEELQYAWRLNGGDWSPFSNEKSVIFETLDSGNYRFEVKARDLDFNEDPTPAVVQFTVIPPVYQQTWFIGLMVILFSAIGFQTMRVVRRDKNLRESNAALSDANRELFDVNVTLEEANEELQRDRAVEHIRAQVQAMEKAEDLESVLSVVTEELKAVGLNVQACEIDVLDRVDDHISMRVFEAQGFHYTTYKLDTDGGVHSESYHIPAPFPDVNRATIERFIAGEPWQALLEGKQAVVEVPIGRYGRLRLTDQREEFSEDDVETLRAFTGAIALGYARYLDFIEVQLQTQRKTDFLSAMSHELRTPLTAIKGFVDNMLEGITGELNERQERNLNRVNINANNLLGLVNDLLDIAKIEAGRMDVDTKTFSIRDLIINCCETVGPLVQTDVSLTYEIADNVRDVNSDEDKLRHIIRNLLSNAVKFTDHGEIVVRAHQHQDQLVISVSDTGVGMPPESLATIFDEFNQVRGSEQRHKGTGLGLAIVKQYTELLRGSVRVESEVGKGTTFTVQVPKIYPISEI